MLESQEGEQGRFSSEVKRLQQRIEESQREFDQRAQSSATVISNLEAKLVRLVLGGFTGATAAHSCCNRPLTCSVCGGVHVFVLSTQEEAIVVAAEEKRALTREVRALFVLQHAAAAWVHT